MKRLQIQNSLYSKDQKNDKVDVYEELQNRRYVQFPDCDRRPNALIYPQNAAVYQGAQSGNEGCDCYPSIF